MPAKLRRILQMFVPLAAAFVVVVLVRGLLVTQFTVTSSVAPFLKGDRLLINRMAYGVRMPLENFLGYHRIGSTHPERGEWMAFYLPSDTATTEDRRQVCVAQCMALPGDTLFISKRAQRISLHRASFSDQLFVIPSAGSRFTTTPSNVQLLGLTMDCHEGLKVKVRNGQLFVDGQMQNKAWFSQNYYWVYSPDGNDSRRYGLVPASALMGSAFCVSYSVDVDFPFYTPFRKGRFFRTTRQLFSK